MKTIARIHTNFPEKFGIPRQSGIVDTPGYIVFEPPYNNPDAVRGLEGFSHIWLIWEFSKSIRKGADTASANDDWSPTVRPPRLGGNTRVGVFASRSPYRPNPIGLSCVELDKIVIDSKLGPVLYVKGADILDDTPIYDIKPYLPYSEAKTEARGGFAHKVKDNSMEVVLEAKTVENTGHEQVPVPAEELETIKKLLAQDPRPHYQNDPERIYGMTYGDWEIKFKTEGQKITVIKVFRKS